MAQGKYTLYGCKGCGSTPVELVLEMHDLPYDYIDVEPWETSPNVAKLEQVNPLGQVPTLVTPQGAVLTESAGILLWLLQQTPASPLLPSDAVARASLYRWTVFIAANIYSAISVGDFPNRWVEGEEAQKSLKAGTIKRSHTYWKMLEDSLQPAPYLLGESLSALDVYAAAVTRWRPGRKALAEKCPKLIAAVELAEKHPAVARVWSRNFTA